MMRSPLARLLADLAGRPRPAWRVVAAVGHRCFHVDRVPSGIAADEKAARAWYLANRARLVRADAVRCIPITDDLPRQVLRRALIDLPLPRYGAAG